MSEYEDLLSGPRGRRLCLSLVTTAIPSLWTLVRNTVTHPSAGELFEELLRELADIDATTVLDTIDEAALLVAFEASVSAARYSRLVTTTRALPSLGAAKLTLVEDAFSWSRARLWALGPASGCRIYEITGPEAWVELVAQYPLDVSLEKRHDWWRVTGHDGTWLIPDWEAVAADYDAVHLTALGYLTTAGRRLAAAGSHTMLAGWNPAESYWLNDMLTETAPPVEWQRDYRHGGPWHVATP